MQSTAKKMKQMTVDEFRAILGAYVEPKIIETLVTEGITSVDLLKELEVEDLVRIGVKTLAAKATLNAAKNGSMDKRGDRASAATEVNAAALSGGKVEENTATSGTNREAAAAPAKTTTTTKTTTTVVETIVPKPEVADRMKGPIAHLYRRLEDQGVKKKLVVACTACIMIRDARDLPSIVNKDVDDLMNKTDFLSRVQNNQCGMMDDEFVMNGTADAFSKCGVERRKAGHDGPFRGFTEVPARLKGEVVKEIAKRREEKKMKK
jgi:hypothetical protein